MDREQFDALARSIGAKRSRRAAFVALAGSVLAAYDASADRKNRRQRRRKRRRKDRLGLACVPLGHVCSRNGYECCDDNAICTGAIVHQNPFTFCLDRLVPGDYEGCTNDAECTARFPKQDVVCQARGLLDCPPGADKCCKPRTCHSSADCSPGRRCCFSVEGQYCCGAGQYCDFFTGCSG